MIFLNDIEFILAMSSTKKSKTKTSTPNPNETLTSPKKRKEPDQKSSRKKMSKSPDSIGKQLTRLKSILSSISTPYTLKTDLDLSAYSISDISHDENYEPPLRKITGIRLTWLTAQEIENMSVAPVQNPKLNGIGSVYDPRYGTIANHEKCPTCSQNWKDCTGHMGSMKSPYSIPHPVVLKHLSDLLTCFCHNCHRLVLTWKQMKTLGIMEYHKENRFRAFLLLAKKAIRCSHCKKPHGRCIVSDDKFIKCYKKRTDIKFPLTYEEVVSIILNIRDQEIALLGFKDPLSHPKHMIISSLCILPPSARPWVKGGSGIMHDDLTHKYIEIEKKVEKLDDSGIKEKIKLDAMDDLMFHVKTLFDNSKNKARDVNGKRSLRAIKQRVSGKAGMVRNNIQGKRTVESARSVISPDPDIHVCDVGFPKEFAEKLMYPERVTLHNLAYCQKLLEDGKVLRILSGNTSTDGHFACFTRGFKLLYGDVVIRNGHHIYPDSLPPSCNFQIRKGDHVLRYEEIEMPDGTFQKQKRLIKDVEPPQKKNYKLRPGQIIERQLRDGDWVLFNRQPTLHEPSIRAKRIKIHPHRTLRMDLSSTGAHGADFDGDEMNSFTNCSENSRAEAQELMSTEAQFISGADSYPMLQIKQDNMIGGYLFTRGRVPILREMFMDACCLLMSTNEAEDRKKEYIGLLGHMTLEQVTSKLDHIHEVHKWTGLLEAEIREIKSSIAEYKTLDTLKDEFYKIKSRLQEARNSGDSGTITSFKLELKRKKEEIQKLKDHLSALDREIEHKASDNLLYSGHSLFSTLFPNDFEFEQDTKLSPDKQPLRITRGVVISGTFNNSSLHRIIHLLYKDYQAAFACDFVTLWQRLTNFLLSRECFSVGLGDCIPKNTKIIEEELEKAFLQAKQVESGPLDAEQKEIRILEIMNKATNVGERIVREGIDPNNNFLHMISCGSKGKMFNYVNSVSAVGQQNLSGKRVPQDCGGRSLPCYPNNAQDEESTHLTEFEKLTRHYQSRGFISSSFYSGLTAQEFFFLSAGGREGLIDTSVKTATCGYLSKRMLKLMEDVKIGYNQMVTNAKGTIVQFCYGDDNYSAPELIRTEKHGIQPVDVKHLVERLNKNVAWRGRQPPPDPPE